jgi:hypothetical protein
MTSRSLSRLLAVPALALALAACGGGGTPEVEQVAAETTGISSSTEGGGEDASHATGTGSARDGEQPGNPGAPGGGDAGEVDVEGGGNPGAPGDVAVFEEGGVPFSVLRDDAANTCADGVCALQEPVVSAGDPDDLGGVDACLIPDRSDIVYDPPARNGFFQVGATVTAHVDCTVEEAAGSPAEDPDDGTVDDGTVDDGTVDDGTVDDGTVDDGTVDDGAGETPVDTQ